jgi:hypothetical protein
MFSAEQGMSWPDALVTVAFLALVAFVIWATFVRGK